MLIDVKCPKCREKIPVNESASEQIIDCHGCGKRFPVPGSGAPAGEDKDEAKPKDKDRDRDRDEPRGKKSSPRRTRRDDDDDEDEESVGRSRRHDDSGGSGMVGLLIFGGIGLAVLAVGFGITAWLIFSDSKTETAEATKPESRPAFNNPPPNNFPNNNVPGIPQKPPVDNDPPLRPKAPKPRVEEPDNPPPKKPKIDPPPMVEPKKPEVEVPGAPPPAPAAPFVMLPSPAGDQTAVGGGGKYLFLHIKADRQVAVFNPAEKKIAKYIPVKDDEVVLAAGADHLLIGYPNLRKLERVPLTTLESDKSVDVPSKFPLRGLAIGANAKNPLLAACGNFPHGDEFFLIDVNTLQRYNNTVVPKPGVYPETAMRLWASQDGRTFAVTAAGLSKPHTYQMRSNGWSVNPVSFNLNGMTSDGELLLGQGQLGLTNGQTVGEKKQDRGKGVWYFPAAPGPYFCSVYERTYGEWPKEKKIPELQVHVGRSQESLVTFPELPEMADFVEFFFQRTKTLDRHIFLFPNDDLVAILPASRDRLHYRPVNLKSELAKTKIDYLAVTSRPPSVKFGETFKYKPEVLCKKGPVTLRLDASPVGMKLMDDTLVWTVPTRANQPPANVILSITDAGGQEVFHNFEIAVFAK